MNGYSSSYGSNPYYNHNFNPQSAWSNYQHLNWNPQSALTYNPYVNYNPQSSYSPYSYVDYGNPTNFDWNHNYRVNTDFNYRGGDRSIRTNSKNNGNVFAVGGLAVLALAAVYAITDLFKTRGSKIKIKNNCISVKQDQMALGNDGKGASPFTFPLNFNKNNQESDLDRTGGTKRLDAGK